MIAAKIAGAVLLGGASLAAIAGVPVLPPVLFVMGIMMLAARR